MTPNSAIAKLVRALLPYQAVPYWATPLPAETVTIRFRLDSGRSVFECEGSVTKVFAMRSSATKGRRDV